MIVVLVSLYIVVLALFVWLRFIPLNTFWKLSPLIVLLALAVFLFIPMGWGGPSGPVAVLRNSVQVVPSVAGEVIEVPVAANTPVKARDILFRINPTTYAAQVEAVEAQLKFAELRHVQAAPFVVRIALDDDEVARSLPAGSTGLAAIFTDRVTPSHVIRRVLLRQVAILNYVNPY